MSLFKAATALVVEEKPAKKGKSPDYAVPGMRKLGALKLVMDNMKTLYDRLANTAKSSVFNGYFLREVVLTGRLPENPRGTDGDSHGSIQMKRSTSVLTKASRDLLDAHSIPYEKVTIGVDAYVFNPAIVLSDEMMEAISAALSSIEGLPEGIIKTISSSTNYVASDETIATICAKAKRDETGKSELSLATVKALLELTTTMALGANFDSDKGLNEAMPIATAVLFPSVEDQKAEAEKATIDLRDKLVASIEAEKATVPAVKKSPAKKSVAKKAA